MIESWEDLRATQLASLVGDALPSEQLSADELRSCCWDDPGVVLGLGDGDGAVAAVTRSFGDLVLGWVRLLVVHPAVRRLGHGAELLAAAESWCFEQGAAQVRLGGSAPFYLWPGVDVRWTAGLCLAESAGYRVEGAELNMSCPTTFRAEPPEGVELRRAVDDEDAEALVDLARERWPNWVAELERGVEQGGAFGAFIDREAVGFACHSVNRGAWVGPMATRPGHRGRGIGAALLGELCRDLMVAGFSDAEIAWVGPVSFYAKTAGATVSRVFRSFVKDRGHSQAPTLNTPGGTHPEAS